MSPESDDQISVAIERLSTALVESERHKIHTDSMIAAMRTDNERLTEENTGLKAKLCCTEGWGKSLTAALAENERLLVRINDQNVDYKKLEDDNTKCLKIIGELRTENERLKAGMREYACTGTDHQCGCYDQFLSERAEIERLTRERDEWKRLAQLAITTARKPEGPNGRTQCCGPKPMTDIVTGSTAFIIENAAEVEDWQLKVEAWKDKADRRANELERLRALYGRCIEALIWCSGSADFGPGGQAHEGWQKLAKPLLDDFCEFKAMSQEPTITVAMYRDAVRDLAELRTEIERLKIENDKMLWQLEKIADFMVHPYSAARAVLRELGKWKEPKP